MLKRFPLLGDTHSMPLPNNLRTAIFDLDGTLTDSRPGILGCLQRALHAHAIVWEGPLDWFIGPPAGQSFAKLIPDRDAAFRTQVLQQYRACYAATGWAENALYPGILALLRSLRERSVTLYVCTSKRDDFARRILDHFALTPFFAGIIADHGASENHNKADLLTELIAAHGIERATAAMIGDREFDMLAARAVGLSSIAVLYGFGSAEELTAASPDATCASVEDLSQLLLAHAAANSTAYASAVTDEESST